MEKQFPALDREYDDAGKSVIVKDTPAVSRKRKLVNAKTSRARSTRIVKRPRRISSSSEELLSSESESDDSDSDDDYKLDKKLDVSDDSSSSDDVEMKKEESDFDPESESDISSEAEESSDFSTPSDDSDSEFEDKKSGKKRNVQPVGKSKVKLSKVQEHIMKQHRESGNATKKGVAGEKVPIRNGIIDAVRDMKDELLKKIEDLGERLPKNTLDDLINKLGGSEIVAEMTGRKVLFS